MSIISKPYIFYDFVKKVHKVKKPTPPKPLFPTEIFLLKYVSQLEVEYIYALLLAETKNVNKYSD